ncbi:MAG TPA: FHA domain-containing protein, partial [Polyangiaceae bacterium]
MMKSRRRPPVDDRLPEAYTYTLIKSAPDVNPDEVELRDVSAIEVVILWESTVLYVGHLTPPRSFYVGEESKNGAACDYFVPVTKLGIAHAPLVIADGDSVRVVVLPGARGTVELPGQAATSLESARHGAELYENILGAYSIRLPWGGRVRMEKGGLVFQVAAVAAGKRISRGATESVETASAGYFGLSFAAHASMFAAMAFFVPPLGLTDREGQDRDQQYLIQHYLEASAARELAATDLPSEVGADTRQESPRGQRAAFEEGSMGRPNVPLASRRFAVKGAADNVDVHLSQLAEARDFGMIGLLKGGAAMDPNAPTAPWGQLDSSGRDPLSALGNMWGATIGDSLGGGAYGLSGTGQGGGGDGTGVGIDKVGTIGGGNGDVDGVARSSARLMRGHA